MITHLSGTVLIVNKETLVLDVRGVGYRIFAGAELLSVASTETELSIWTYLAVRETALDLYGFLTQAELTLFKLIISVSGIGPKSGLAILSLATIETLQNAITSGDIGYLTRVSGIGAKTAQKIIIELKDKVPHLTTGSTTEIYEDTDVLEALRTLGYTTIEARSALKNIPPETSGTSERVRAALKSLT
jgi:Holliday junction DNA helicase RuvA